MSKPPIPERLTIITTTHLLPSAPLTLVLSRTIDLLRKYLPVAGCRHMVFYDQPTGRDHLDAPYRANLATLAEKYGLELYIRPKSGVKANLLEGLSKVTTPYVLFLEHDWAFRRPVELETLLDVFDKYDHVNIVRFNMRRNDSHYMWDHFSIEDERIRELPLTMTSSWSNQAHIARVSKWRKDWIPMLGPEKSERSFGVEEVLYNAYNRDIFNKGFHVSNADWGSYIYGPYHCAPYVYHTNGSVVRGGPMIELPLKAWRFAKRLVRGHYDSPVDGAPKAGSEAQADTHR
jgi:hypothetical protein